MTKRAVKTVFGSFGTLGESEMLYRFVLESLTEFAVFSLTPGGIIRSWNSGAQRTFGYAADEAIGEHFSIIFTPEDIEAGAPAEELRVPETGRMIDHDRWHVRKDGSRFWGINAVHPMYGEHGELIGFAKLVRDITEQHLAEEATFDSEQRLRLLVESVEGYGILSIGLDDTITSWNDGAESILGYRSSDIVGQPLSVLVDNPKRGEHALETMLRETSQSGTSSAERWLIRKDKTRLLASSRISRLKCGADGQSRGYVMVLHDITRERESVREIEHRALHDQLTRLPNRSAFYEHVGRALVAIKRRPAHLFAVLFIDLDHFKEINDSYGHLLADKLLERTARRLELALRSRDVLARLGGDEFAILLTGVDGIADALDASERIMSELAQPTIIDGYEVLISASIGIAMGDPIYESGEDILADADTAMYLAKTSGRARTNVFNRETMQHQRSTRALQADLHHALDRAELRVEYQPIVKLPERRLVGFEALVRWQHPQRGLLQPHDFISSAEATNAIIAIDRWVFRTACEKLAAWKHRHPGASGLKMSVNFSSKQFASVDLLDELQSILVATGVAPRSMRMEITETGIVDRSAFTSDLLGRIKDAGLALHIDDFGVGYASMESLGHMPVQTLKIDRSFVSSMDTETGKRLVRSLVTLGHSLDLEVVAEGVETREQLEYLEQSACDYAQGFYFSKPLDADAAEQYLATSEYARVSTSIDA